MMRKHFAVPCLVMIAVACSTSLVAQDMRLSRSGEGGSEEPVEASGEEQGLVPVLHSVRTYVLDGIEADVARRILLTALGGADGLRIEVEEASNRLIVQALPEMHAEIGEILKVLSELDPSSDGPSSSDGANDESNRVQRNFTLRYPVDPNRVVQQFEALFGDEGKWAVNVTGEGIRFHGTEEQVQAAADLVATLDRPMTKILSLQHADATQLAALIERLYAGPTLTVAVDERTNQIVASGLQDDLEIISAVLQNLDKPATGDVRDAVEEWTPVRDIMKKGKPLERRSTNARTGDLTHAADGAAAAHDEEKAISKLREEFEAAEQEALHRAQDYRRWKETGVPEGPLQRQRLKIKAAVERAFEIRQRLQSMELEQLREQLNEIEQRVQQREALKERIVERRIEDLLTDADLSWAPSAGAAADGEPRVAVGRASDGDMPPRAADLAKLKGTVQVEAMPGTDSIVLRGDEADVRALMEILEKLEGRETTSRAEVSHEVKVDFRHVPWEDVLEWLAKQHDAVLQADQMPRGTLNLSGSMPLDEVHKELNRLLHSQGLTIDLQDGVLRVRVAASA